MSEPTITFTSLSPLLRGAVALSVLQSLAVIAVIGLATRNAANQQVAVQDTPAPAPVSAGPDLNCLVQLSHLDAILGGSNLTKEPFVCGGYQFKLVTYNQVGAEDWLGGLLPDNKSLKSLGCQVDGGKVLCREEKEYGPKLTAYRSFTATYEKIAPAQ